MNITMNITMNIIYKSDDFNIPTNINDKIYLNKEGGGGIKIKK